MGTEQKPPVDDVQADLQQDSRQQRRWDLSGQRSCSQQHHQQHQGVRHAGERCLAAGFDVDHRAHGGA